MADKGCVTVTHYMANGQVMNDISHYLEDNGLHLPYLAAMLLREILENNEQQKKTAHK